MIQAALAVLENDKQRNELATCYEQYKNRFFSIAYSKLHNSEEAEDAVQEAFLRVANNPNKFFTISPEEKYITDASADELVRFVLALPESQRQALFMYIHEKLTYSEISKILGISENLARKRVSNARKAIKDFAERNKK